MGLVLNDMSNNQYTSQDILRKTAVFMQNHGWCKYDFARNIHETSVDSLDDSAVSFCAYGACLKVGGDLGAGLDEIMAATDHFKKVMGHTMIYRNDCVCHTKQQMVDALYLASRRTGWKIIDFFIR